MKPIPMRLPCPGLVERDDGRREVCGALHVDAGAFAYKPHHTHACQVCGHVWRPAVEPTVGVRFLPGFRDSDPTAPVPARKRRVVIESPWKGDTARHGRYAVACLRDALRRGEAPLASHVTIAMSGALDDGDPASRELGLEAGFAWIEMADVLVVYNDLGISEGMRRAIARANDLGIAVEHRSLGDGWDR